MHPHADSGCNPCWGRYRTSLLAAIDIHLVHFSELIICWNAMENVIKAAHVCDCACYIIRRRSRNSHALAVSGENSHENGLHA